MTFAVTKAVEGVELEVVGWILMAGGALSLLVAAIQGAGWMSMGKTKMRTERHASDDGQHYVEETSYRLSHSYVSPNLTSKY